MKITVELAPSYSSSPVPEVVEVYLDKEGLAYLLQELSRLNDAGDHAHFMTPSWGMDDLSEEKYAECNTLVHHLKVTLV